HAGPIVFAPAFFQNQSKQFVVFSHGIGLQIYRLRYPSSVHEQNPRECQLQSWDAATMQPQHLSSLIDTQNLPDHREVAIDRVGVTNLRFPIQVRDKAHATQNTVATVALTVDLPHHFKGTHMSRFVEVLNEHGSLIHVDNIKVVLRHLQERLNSKKAHVEFEFPYFIEKRAPVSGAAGLMDYVVRLEATTSHDDSDFVVTVIVPVTTLCPCSKAISRYGAHNQRGQVTFSVRFNKSIWIEDLIQLVESSASSELYSLLKRPDEK